MQFTGRNLALVAAALAGAKSDIRMHIGSCPDVHEYAEDIEYLEAEYDTYDRLLRRIQTKHPELVHYE